MALGRLQFSHFDHGRDVRVGLHKIAVETQAVKTIPKLPSLWGSHCRAAPRANSAVHSTEVAL